MYLTGSSAGSSLMGGHVTGDPQVWRTTKREEGRKCKCTLIPRHERKVWNRSVEGIDICIYRIVKSSRTTTYCEEKENATGTIHTHEIRKISYEATRFLLSTRRAGEQELAGTPRTHARGTHDSSFSTLAIYGWRATWRDARRHGVIKVPLSMGNCNPQSLQPLQLLCHVVFSTRDFSLSISRP